MHFIYISVLSGSVCSELNLFHLYKKFFFQANFYCFSQETNQDCQLSTSITILYHANTSIIQMLVNTDRKVVCYFYSKGPTLAKKGKNQRNINTETQLDLQLN